jgi:hypothetical protein
LWLKPLQLWLCWWSRYYDGAKTILKVFDKTASPVFVGIVVRGKMYKMPLVVWVV